MVTDFIDIDLTPEAIKDARDLIGIPLRRRRYNTEATEAAIDRWARSIGDRNPLWLNLEHGKRSIWGTIVAPPCWLYSVDNTLVAPKLPGIHALYGGTSWEFRQYVRLGDRITVDARLVDMEVKRSSFCGTLVVQKGQVSYFNQHGQEVARALSTVVRAPRKAARKKGLYMGYNKYIYTAEELASIWKQYDIEEIRGDTPRFWDDVQEGAKIQPIVRGPLTSEDIVQFWGATCPSLTYSHFLAYRRRHPYVAFKDPELNIWDSWEASILDEKVARLFGFPLAHDCGIDRISWVSNLLTNWMGDQGFLRALSIRLLLPNFHGDTTWCNGKIIGKRIEGDEHLVEFEVWCTNQRGETTAKGTALVSLPAKTR